MVSFQGDNVLGQNYYRLYIRFCGTLQDVAVIYVEEVREVHGQVFSKSIISSIYKVIVWVSINDKNINFRGTTISSISSHIMAVIWCTIFIVCYIF